MANRHLYILDERGQPVPCADPQVAKAWASEVDRSVAFDMVGMKRVVTLFTVVPVGETSDGKPVLWETALADADNVLVVDRYSSLKEALAGHDRILARVQAQEIRFPGREGHS